MYWKGFGGIRPHPNSQGDNQVHLVPPELTDSTDGALLISPLWHQGLVLLSQSTVLWLVHESGEFVQSAW